MNAQYDCIDDVIVVFIFEMSRVDVDLQLRLIEYHVVRFQAISNCVVAH